MAKGKKEKEVQFVGSGLFSVKAKRWDEHKELGNIKLPAEVAVIAGKTTLTWQDKALILNAGQAAPLNRKYFEITEV